MKYDTISNFPTSIDSLLFFQDICINDVPFVNKYNECIKNNLFDEANAINFTLGSKTFTYSAGLFNLIVNRIETTQSYLLAKSPLVRETISIESPRDIQIGQTWIAIDND